MKCGSGVEQAPSAGAQAAPVQPGTSAPAVPGTKNKLVAGLLGVFLGWTGAHRFYLGYTGLGIAMLVISLVSIVLMFVCVGYFTWLGVWIWGLVEGIMILAGGINKDAEGRPLVS